MNALPRNDMSADTFLAKDNAAKELVHYFSSKMSISDVRSSSNRIGMPCNS